MKSKLAVLAAAACLVMGGPTRAQEQTPQTAQSTLATTVTSWGRISSERLPVHYKVTSVTAQSNNCSTVFRYENNTVIVLNWNEAGDVVFRNLQQGSSPYLVKVLRPSGYVQLYFQSSSMAERVLAVANFLKAACDPTGGAFG